MNGFHFDTGSYFTGLLTGMIIRWTDIIPIFGGFLIGISIKRLPEFIDLSALPVGFTEIIGFLKRNKGEHAVKISTQNQLKIPIIKKK